MAARTTPTDAMLAATMSLGYDPEMQNWCRLATWATLTMLVLLTRCVATSSRSSGHNALTDSVAPRAPVPDSLHQVPTSSYNAGAATASARAATDADSRESVSTREKPTHESPTEPLLHSAAHRQLQEIEALARNGKLDDAHRRLAEELPAIDRTGTLDEQLVAHVIMARIERESNAPNASARHFGRVHELWRSPTQAVQRIGVRGETDSEHTARLVHALDGVGEVVFYEAEETSRKVLEASSLPQAEAQPLSTPADNSAGGGPQLPQSTSVARKMGSSSRRRPIERFENWFAMRQSGVEKAESEYGKVLAIEPMSPPRWSIASLARVGELWANFADDYARVKRSVFEGTIDEDKRSIYSGLVEPVSDPRRKRARQAFEQCRYTAEKYHIRDKFSELCLTSLRTLPLIQ